jgi:hypothetical protein
MEAATIYKIRRTATVSRFSDFRIRHLKCAGEIWRLQNGTQQEGRLWATITIKSIILMDDKPRYWHGFLITLSIYRGSRTVATSLMQSEIKARNWFALSLLLLETHHPFLMSFVTHESFPLAASSPLSTNHILNDDAPAVSTLMMSRNCRTFPANTDETTDILPLIHP